MLLKILHLFLPLAHPQPRLVQGLLYSLYQNNTKCSTHGVDDPVLGAKGWLIHLGGELLAFGQ